MRSGSLNIPPQSGRPGAVVGAMPGARFEGPRSPPSKSLFPSRRSPLRHRSFLFGTLCVSRHSISVGCAWPTAWFLSAFVGERVLTWRLRPADTSHVPCKFFRQGACQAGNACPFSHDLSSASETVCKYFAKVRRADSPFSAAPGASANSGGPPHRNGLR